MASTGGATHQHVTAFKTRKDGTTDRHRFTVAIDQAEAEREISRQMGYEVKSELCYDDCLGGSVKS